MDRLKIFFKKFCQVAVSEQNRGLTAFHASVAFIEFNAECYEISDIIVILLFGHKK